ncbi:MAG: DsrE family protein [Gemmatimonadetes bacterium]|nr:DsrE family protein [Gemmatimonadota bacterium]
MAKISIVVLADTKTHGDLGRIANALTTAQECKQAGDEVELLFDGAGVKWVAELSAGGHKLEPAFRSIEDRVAGACAFCAQAFGVRAAVESSGIPLLDEYKQHPSLRRRVADGYEIITF